MWEPDFSLLPEAAPVAPVVVPVVAACPCDQRIPSPELGPLFSAHEHAPKRVRLAAAATSKPVREYTPYHQRLIARRKPADPKHPFRHAGLMSDIGGVEGFMCLVRGTHRPVEEWETVSETF